MTNFASLLGFVSFALGPAIAAAGSCESLASLSLPNATITSVGAGRASDLPAFCRVALTIKPSSDSDIQVEVWLPSSGWNGAVDRTRPLCPYPQVASYKGSGSTDEAANFDCKVP